MSQEAFDAVLTNLLDRKPFSVFTIELSNGTRFEVDHPRAMVLRDGVAVFLVPGGHPIWFDHHGVTSVAGTAASNL